MKTVDVVVPLYNEENLVDELVQRLQKATDGLSYSFRFIMVDDGSRDRTLERIRTHQLRDHRFTVISLSRNWGHQCAFNAGIDYADADAVILMDGDLEDPPELIADFVRHWENGADVVYAKKNSRVESLFKKLLYRMFYSVMRRFSNVTIEKQVGMFSLLDRRAHAELKKCREHNKYYVGLRSFVGFKQVQICYERHKRFSGKPKQTLDKLLTLGMNAIFSFSFLPMRLLTSFGIILLGTIAAVATVLFFARLFRFSFWPFYVLPGWTSLVLILLFISAIQLIFLGVIGEYVARVYDETRHRPHYIIDRIYTAESAVQQPEKEELVTYG